MDNFKTNYLFYKINKNNKEVERFAAGLAILEGESHVKIIEVPTCNLVVPQE